ncbi:hypothetical protein T03_150 [Trichinella britovi]|uniref:Uncharacterized protein n=1 Tax=Trichinella britovi TaxID=45882 RepID=A0A0V1DAI6_TRIBR|nr:hypothetical protein T03_150 [Trichinella britovi]KRZ92772.1 hypothetical protein T08_9285 [Trichinella sp. T8]
MEGRWPTVSRAVLFDHFYWAKAANSNLFSTFYQGRKQLCPPAREDASNCKQAACWLLPLAQAPPKREKNNY